MGGTPADRALHRLQRAPQAARRTRDQDRTEPDRVLHHVARDGGHARSRCSSWTTSSPACGTHRSARRASGGARSAVEAVRVTVPVRRGRRLDRGVRASTVAENREYLTQLDSAIGDADHGINMDRGMQAVLAKLDGLRGGRRRRLAQDRRHDARVHASAAPAARCTERFSCRWAPRPRARASSSQRTGRPPSTAAVDGVQVRGQGGARATRR